MALPLSRGITVVSGGQIPSTLLNSLQDSIIGGKHGPKTLQISVAGIEGDAVTTYSFADGAYIVPASRNLDIAVPLHESDRIISYGIQSENITAAADFITFSLHKSATRFGAAVEGFPTTTVSGIGIHKDIFTLTTPETIATDFRYFIVCQAAANAGDMRLNTFFVTYDRP